MVPRALPEARRLVELGAAEMWLVYANYARESRQKRNSPGVLHERQVTLGCHQVEVVQLAIPRRMRDLAIPSWQALGSYRGRP